MPRVQSDQPQVNTIRWARVSKSYSEKHCVDLVFLDDGGFLTGVPILSPAASQGHGLSYLPTVKDPDGGRWAARLAGEDDVMAAVAWASGHAVVLGFFFPAGGNMGVGENVLRDRHISGFERRITADGDMSLIHPRGWLVEMTTVDGVTVVVKGARIEVKPDENIWLRTGGARINVNPNGNVYLN